jgi:hypothetical protein
MTLPKGTAVIALATMAAVTITASVVSGHKAAVQQSWVSPPAGEPTIVGVWRTRVRPRNCETGEVAPVSGLRGLFTFHEGGTASEYGIGPGQTPALRSPGHGLWRREPGWQEYRYAFTYYRYDASGAFVGSQRVTSALVLDASGDAFTSNSDVEVFDASDTLIMTVCATAAGTRFE